MASHRPDRDFTLRQGSVPGYAHALVFQVHRRERSAENLAPQPAAHPRYAPYRLWNTTQDRVRAFRSCQSDDHVKHLFACDPVAKRGGSRGYQ